MDMDSTLTDNKTSKQELSNKPSESNEKPDAERGRPDNEAKGTGELIQEWLGSLGTDKMGAVPMQPYKEVDKTHPFGELPSKLDRPREANAPTLLVLDDYRYHEVALKDEHGFSHGEISARMAEENGLNVKRFQVEISKAGAFELGNSMIEIAKRIDSGELKLPEGTALNLSFGLSMTYDQVSSALNMNITPENVKEKRLEIVKKLDEMFEGKKLSINASALAEAADTNRGIMELQKRGIKVISAAGNEGPEYINLGTLAADVQYSALTPNGGIADYSGKNSFTKDGRGQVDFYFQPIDLANPKSIIEQSGTYSVDGTNIKLDAAEFGGMRFDKAKMQPESLRILDAQIARDLNSPDGQDFDYRRLHEIQTDLKKGEGAATAYGIGKFIKDPHEGFTQLSAGIRSALNPFTVQRLNTAASAMDYNQLRKGKMVESTYGTSFVNVFKIKEEFPQT
ncbi:MAG: hypothetical protein K2X77_25070 [Candidatus Obscuribacterales bacterium]|jgi:hypothetical protein|nr:hypothetical protein [Candidatus Obscuribacterales bacterium]